MKTKCYSVQLMAIEKYSDKAYKVTDEIGTSDFIPASQVYGPDIEEVNHYWLSSWILERKNLAYSTSRQAWFDEEGNMMADYNKEKKIKMLYSQQAGKASKQPVPIQQAGSFDDLPF